MVSLAASTIRPDANKDAHRAIGAEAMALRRERTAPHDLLDDARARGQRESAMLAILDGPSVDDGTACEIGMFHALMQSDPSKKGIVGLLTDIRSTRGESTGVNLFVQGAIEDVGRIVASIDEARDVLRAWR
jgi:hypothetical protein